MVVFRLLRNLGFDEMSEQGQRLLPTQVAICDGYHRRQPFLHDLELVSAVDLSQCDGDLHLAGQAGVIELVRVPDSLVRRELDVPLLSVIVAPIYTSAEPGENRHPARR